MTQRHKVSLLWRVAPEQTIGILVRASLPAGMGVGKVGSPAQAA